MSLRIRCVVHSNDSGVYLLLRHMAGRHMILTLKTPYLAVKILNILHAILILPLA